MGVVLEKNGWKLTKLPERHKYKIVTPEGFTSINMYNPNPDSTNEEYLDRIIERGWVWCEVEYYSGTIKDGEIVLRKYKKDLKSNFILDFYSKKKSSREAVIEKLTPILQKANEKFEVVKNKFIQLQNELDVDISYYMDGDTHGIYEDYMHVSFTIDDVICNYRLD